MCIFLCKYGHSEVKIKVNGTFFHSQMSMGSLIEEALRTWLVLSAMITSNSGCDLRTPVDVYAFKCEAKQCSLEVVVTAPRCPACACIGRRCASVFQFPLCSYVSTFSYSILDLISDYCSVFAGRV